MVPKRPRGVRLDVLKILTAQGSCWLMRSVKYRPGDWYFQQHIWSINIYTVRDYAISPKCLSGEMVLEDACIARARFRAWTFSEYGRMACAFLNLFCQWFVMLRRKKDTYLFYYLWCQKRNFLRWNVPSCRWIVCNLWLSRCVCVFCWLQNRMFVCFCKTALLWDGVNASVIYGIQHHN